MFALPPQQCRAGTNTNYVASTTAWTFSLRENGGVPKDVHLEQNRVRAVDTLIAKVLETINSKVIIILITAYVIDHGV